MNIARRLLQLCVLVTVLLTLGAGSALAQEGKPASEIVFLAELITATAKMERPGPAGRFHDRRRLTAD
jgi:hypothetical protein